MLGSLKETWKFCYVAAFFFWGPVKWKEVFSSVITSWIVLGSQNIVNELRVKNTFVWKRKCSSESYRKLLVNCELRVGRTRKGQVAPSALAFSSFCRIVSARLWMVLWEEYWIQSEDLGSTTAASGLSWLTWSCHWTPELNFSHLYNGNKTSTASAAQMSKVKWENAFDIIW